MTQGRLARHRQRAVQIGPPQAHQVAQRFQRRILRQRRHLEHRVARHQITRHRIAGSGGRQLAQPWCDQLVAARIAGAVQHLRRDLHQPRTALAAGAQAVDPVVKVNVTEQQADGEFRRRLREARAQAQPLGAHGRQALDQLLLPHATHQADRQHAFARQAFGAHRQRGAHVADGLGLAAIVQQVVFDLVTLQRIEAKRFFVIAHVRGVGKHDAQPAPEEKARRLAQETGQFAQLEDKVGFELVRRQGIVDRVLIGAVRGAPFARVREQAAALEVAPAERLQRMLGRDVMQVVHVPAGLQVVAQLRHQHRWRLLAVVAHIAADPAHVELVARSQQRFEHQVAVVVAARAIAGPRHAGQRQQVEVGRARAAREVAIVHAQQADGAKRHRAHRHQGAEGHAARHELVIERGRIEFIHPRFAQHRQRHRFVKAGTGAGLEPALQALAQVRQRQAVGFVAGRIKARQHLARRLAPFGRPQRCIQAAAPRQQAFDQLGERAGQRGIEATDFGVRLDVAETGAGAAGVAEQHAAHAEDPGILLARHPQAQARAVVVVQAPAHAGAIDPAAQDRQILTRHAKAARDGRHVKQVAHLALAAALLGQA